MPSRPRAPVRASTLALAAVAALGLAACSSDGREMREPGPDQTASIVTTTAAPAPTEAVDTAPAPLVLLGSWAPGGLIPSRNTCKGEGLSPSLSWSGVPFGAVEVAIVVTDPDAGGFVHWVLAGIDPEVNALAEGSLPPGVAQARNDAGTSGWFGPCPPEGQSHAYVFTVYALSEGSGVTDGEPAETAIDAIAGSALASATLEGRYP